MRQLVLLAMMTTCWASATAGEAPRPTSAADQQFFEAKVRPLLVERCHACHSTKSRKQRGGLLLDSRTGISRGGDSGPAIVPGEPEKSRLIQAIRYQDASLQMPPKRRLSRREVAILEEWVRRGAAMPEDSVAPARHAIDLAEARKFWSFQSPRMAAPPATRDRAWPQRPIDAFVLAELEKHGLSPSPPAARRALLRRVYFDLIGLPPSPEEVDAFLADPAPDAYARRVERLLAAPAYGERWRRYWLDLARYCDIAEPWAESKGQPYLYRDWVVQALNDDLPYDQFVQRQLAADVLPDTVPADRAALGFLGLSPTYWKELKLDKDVIKTVVAEEWEERIDAVCRTFLGLTVACARCHDHKFDPITQQDYYALAGVFASIRQADLSVADWRSLTDFRLPAAAATTGFETAVMVRHMKRPLALGVVDASLHVLADGAHHTKLEWRAGVAQDIPLHIRGNPSRPGSLVPRRFLAVLSPDPPRSFHQGSGRRELAGALVTDGAPLTARVMVNRVWSHHFGRGLVDTPSDFGSQGARPSHPQLLDDLTARFIAHGWSLKWLHREIVLSATYQQASSHNEHNNALDPDNRWLWRMNRRRLEVEAWRDAMLAVTGTLSLVRGGPPQELSDPNNRRRTIYGTVKRRELNDLLRLNDFPDPMAHSPARVPTTTPLQQLFVLNSPFMQQQAAALVRRIKTEAPESLEARVQQAYRLLYGRPATEGQVKLAIAFLKEGSPRDSEQDTRWQQYAQVLLGNNEFLFVD